MAPTTDSITANAGAVLACSDDVRVGKPYSQTCSTRHIPRLDRPSRPRRSPLHSPRSHSSRRIGSCLHSHRIPLRTHRHTLPHSHHTLHLRPRGRHMAMPSRSLSISRVLFAVSSDVPVGARALSAMPAGRSGTLGAVFVVATAPSNPDGVLEAIAFELDASAFPCCGLLLEDADGSHGFGLIAVAMIFEVARK